MIEPPAQTSSASQNEQQLALRKAFVDSVRVPVEEETQVADARRTARRMALELNFAEPKLGKLGIVVTEAATNLLKHAVRGEILLRRVEEAGIAGVEILVLDRGHGIENVARALSEGYSIGNGSGSGLGAMMRQADVFDLHTTQGVGSAILIRIWQSPLPETRESWLDTGAVCVPKPGEVVSGDGWAVHQNRNRCLLMVADGLGHGPSAAQASLAAIETFNASREMDPAAIIERAHQNLRSTRGGAMSVMEILLDERRVTYAGIGNISAAIIGPDGPRRLTSLEGVVGEYFRTVRSFTNPLPEGAAVVMHSDGITSRWSLQQYPELHHRRASLLAGILYRDFRKQTDDATVLAARVGSPKQVREVPR